MNLQNEPTTAPEKAPSPRPWWKRLGVPQGALLGVALGAITIALMPSAWFAPRSPAQGKAGLARDHRAHADGAHAGEKANGEFWTCPMFCTRMDGPGECPVCGMTLERFEDTGDLLPLGEPERLALGLRAEEVERHELAREIRTVGIFRADESKEKVIAAWVDGRVERLYADFTGVPVEEGWHLFDLYSPPLYSAQKELLVARDALAASSDGNRTTNENLLKIAREKLELLGLTREQVAHIETLAEPQLTLTIPSPTSGIVLEKMAHQGMYLMRGQPVYRIANLDRLWLMIDVHERDASWVALGQEVSVTIDGLPGRSLVGHVGFINPVLNASTRTLSVRVEVENPRHDIRPGMYATASIYTELTKNGDAAAPLLDGNYACPMHPLQRADKPGEHCPICGMEKLPVPPRPRGQPGEVLAVPREAVLSTGRRHIVYIEIGGEAGHENKPRMYQMLEVDLGPVAAKWHKAKDGTRHKLGDYYPVLRGLTPGMRIVTKGQFLIDSQMELAGKRSLQRGESGQPAADPHAGH